MAVSKIFEAIFHNNEELFMDMLKRGCANAVDDLGDSVLLDCLDKERIVFFLWLWIILVIIHCIKVL